MAFADLSDVGASFLGRSGFSGSHFRPPRLTAGLAAGQRDKYSSIGLAWMSCCEGFGRGEGVAVIQEGDETIQNREKNRNGGYHTSYRALGSACSHGL